MNNKKILIYGFGKSGIAVYEFLKDTNNNLYIFDANYKFKILNKCNNFKENTRKSVKNVKKSAKNSKILLKSNNYSNGNICYLNNFDDIKLLDLDLCIVSPGVDLAGVDINYLKDKGVKIQSELEFGANRCKGKIFAITGTNGKTTTSTLLYNILKSSFENVFLCGNIGIPITSIVNKTTNKSLIVCEVSSFQLESSSVLPFFAVAILNIQSDHLNRHKTFNKYLQIKEKILSNFKSKKILNEDDEKCKYLNTKYPNSIRYSLLSSQNDLFIKEKTNYKKSNKILINTKKIAKKRKKTQKNTKKTNIIEKNISKDIISNTNILNNYEIDFEKEFDIFWKKEKIFSLNKLELVGRCNLENIACAISLAKQINIKNEKIKKVVENFKGLPHRLEYVGEFEGVKYINDSKSTNVASTISALQAVGENVILLLGGSRKDLDFSPLFLNFKIKTTICFGEVCEDVEKVYCNTIFYKTENFKQAVNLAKKISQKGDTVLLSPACASFDEFASYEQRGELFKKLVKK